MAKLYFDEDAPKVWPGGIRMLPIAPLRRKLHEVSTQRLIPFLGAGASLKARSEPADAAPANRPTAASLDRICAEYGLAAADSRRFLEVALQLAQLIAQRPPAPELESDEYAPSSAELAGRLARMLDELDPFRPIGETLKAVLQEPVDRRDYTKVVETVADTLGLSRSIPALLTVASYFNEDDDRPLMLEALLKRFRGVTVGTKIQDRIVEVAKRFVDARNSGVVADKRDYVIITTNYDRLLERALESHEVPTCVVTVRRETLEVFAEVQPHTQAALKLDKTKFDALQAFYEEDDSHLLAAVAGTDTAFGQKPPRRSVSNFSLANKPHSLVMVYKIHGCPAIDERAAMDNIVIADQDYVRFIQQNGDNNCLVPTYVQNVMGAAALLFLGYSFSDWNVRSLYRNFVKSRYFNQHQRQGSVDETKDRDYVVLRSFEAGDNYFFRPWDVSVLVTNLDHLARELAA
jgi:SIR2-like domain